MSRTILMTGAATVQVQLLEGLGLGQLAEPRKVEAAA
jgi:hypothetical protein